MLGKLYYKPHYYNNYDYVQINEVLLKNLLSDIARRSGVENYNDPNFKDSMYNDFYYKLSPFQKNPYSPKLKSIKEEGRNFTKVPKENNSSDDDYFQVTNMIKKRPI